MILPLSAREAQTNQEPHRLIPPPFDDLAHDEKTVQASANAGAACTLRLTLIYLCLSGVEAEIADIEGTGVG